MNQMNLSQARRELTKLTEAREATPEPYPAELTELHQQLLEASRADIIDWLNNELTLAYDDQMFQLLTDWRDFLILKGDPDAALQWGVIPTGKAKQYSELTRRRLGWAGYWDGRGLPPEVREG